MLDFIECDLKVWCYVFLQRIGDWAWFFIVRWIFSRDPEPVFKNPLLFLGVLAGGHCLPGRGVVILVVAYLAFAWLYE